MPGSGCSDGQGPRTALRRRRRQREGHGEGRRGASSGGQARRIGGEARRGREDRRRDAAEEAIALRSYNSRRSGLGSGASAGLRPIEPFDALVKAEDVWANPCERFTGDVAVGVHGCDIAGLPRRITFRRGELAVASMSALRVADAGRETRIVVTHGEHRAESNLVRALRPSEPKTWWGDLHGQTRATVGTGT